MSINRQMDFNIESARTQILFTIRFNGPDLDKRRVQISDLSQTLLATQKLLYKTYIFSENHQSKLINSDRKLLSLQIANIRSGSDIYDLSTIASIATHSLVALASSILTALSYLTYKLFIIDKKEDVWSLNVRKQKIEDKYLELQSVDDIFDNETMLRGKFREFLTAYFNESELKNIAHDLRIEYEELDGSNKGDKARELISYMERRDRLGQLIEYSFRLRRNVVGEFFFDFINIEDLANNDLIRRNKSLALHLFPEAFNIARRVNRDSGIDSVEISSPLSKDIDPVIFNADIKDSMSQVKDSEIIGDYMSISGTASENLNQTNRTITLVTVNSGKIKVLLDQQQFETVRYRTSRDTLITIKGRPIYVIDKDGTDFQKFIGDEVVIPEQPYQNRFDI
jgi:hypothetical protein